MTAAVTGAPPGSWFYGDSSGKVQGLGLGLGLALTLTLTLTLTLALTLALTLTLASTTGGRRWRARRCGA